MDGKLVLKVLSILLVPAFFNSPGVRAEKAPGRWDHFQSIAVPDASSDTQAPVTSSKDVQSNLAPQKTDELVVERYANGKVKIERQVTLNDHEDFVNNGLFRAFDPNGNSIGTGNYRMGKRYGQWERVFRRVEGNVLSKNAGKGFVAPFTSIASFDDGQLDGDWTITDSKDHVVVQWHFVHGRREGAWIWFNPDGSIRRQVTYENGRVAGDMVASDGKDKFKVIQPYLDGRELVPAVESYGQRKKRFEGHYLNPRKITEVHVDWWNGSIETKVVRTEEQKDRHGQWRFWYSNGQLSKQGTYDRGKRVGMFTWWHSNGRKKAEGVYVDDQPSGLWQTWHPSGARRSYGEYTDGKRTGRWLTWHENGMRQFEGQYAGGTLSEPARIWDAQGKRVHASSEKAQQTAGPKEQPSRSDPKNSVSNLPLLEALQLR